MDEPVDAGVPEAVASLVGAVDLLSGIDPAGWTDTELAAAVVALERVRNRFDAARLQVLDAFDARRVWAADHAVSAPAWITHRCRRARAQSRRDTRLARGLRAMPLVAAAFAAGEITDQHVAVLDGARRWAPGRFARDEALLVGHARELRVDDFTRAIAYWRQLADDDRAEDEGRERRRRRYLSAAKSLHGAVSIQGWLDPVAGDLVLGELRRLERTLFEADWADARARLGDEVRPADLARTAAQRWADALAEMARRSAHVGAGSTPRRPLVTVHVDHDTLAGRLCELADGTVITPGELLPLLTTADIERAVFDPAGRVIELGRRSRLFVGGARRAVEIRDRRCVEPGCEVPAEYCDVDHVPDWAQGGRTDPDHGELRCPAHHPNRRRSSPPRRGGPAKPPGPDPP